MDQRQYSFTQVVARLPFKATIGGGNLGQLQITLKDNRCASYP
jgi:hypothetical protein